ncbi:energy-coupling factor transporter transmembrane component T [Aliiroseovarius sp. KMU-50]|uniref:Energy-coupling factor transporter transmembrane component T n=1 Tax=Aliiroseovarius salicola TaxID=3009082 RepID=A0ABT4W664_9RHOB|nr:energy-coupling factor transporter transmembrane component T [Aliiroseovarius sp. KMU-50]MDA5095342.1 energy-coupling factor transporter transmembrane component T [Aliiroseovarius sp. KMU-50]
MISLTSPIRTRAHEWPAGVKLLALAVATALLFSARTVMPQALAFAGMVVLYILPGPEFARAGWRSVRIIWPFVVLIVLWHLVTADYAAGLVIVLRMITAVGLANLVTMTTSLSEFIAVIRWITTPLRRFGLRSEALEVAIALVIRFTPVLVEKGHGLRLAWRARSTRRAGWRIVLPFTVQALDDADHVAEALRARGGLQAMQTNENK